MYSIDHKKTTWIEEIKGGITNNLKLGLEQGSFEKLRLGFEVLMFYQV